MDATAFDTQELNMPVYKKQRRSNSFRRNAKRGGAIMRVPRAISTRGTSDGYYEIPMRQHIVLYGNTSTGLWNTNQSTQAPIGGTGYQGLGMAYTLADTHVYLGNSAGLPIVDIGVAVPDFASFQNIFDLCKIVSTDIEIWFGNHSREMITTAGNYGAPELLIGEDCNDAVPPTTMGQVLDKSKFLRCPSMQDKTFRMSTKPYLTFDGSENSGGGTTSTLAVSQPSTYCRTDRPYITHYGHKGWVSIPSGGTGGAYQYTVNILVKQVRRYKKNN